MAVAALIAWIARCHKGNSSSRVSVFFHAYWFFLLIFLFHQQHRCKGKISCVNQCGPPPINQSINLPLKGTVTATKRYNNTLVLQQYSNTIIMVSTVLRENWNRNDSELYLKEISFIPDMRQRWLQRISTMLCTFFAKDLRNAQLG